jgi:hypothetical protein
MPSTYSPNLKIELMQTGENVGQWGDITNVNLGNVIEQALTFQSIVPVADSPTPTDLTSVDGTSVGDTARSLYIKLTGTLTATRTVRTPQLKHLYVVQNATTQPIIFTSTAGGSVGVTIPVGASALLYCDGVDVLSAVSYLPLLTGAAITNSTINSTPIGGITPSSGVFTNGSAATWNITVGGTLTNVAMVNATGSYASITITAATVNGGTINGTTIGATAPSTGVFTSLTSASGNLNGSIGSAAPNSGAFTSLSSTGVYTNTVVPGTAPMIVTSTTRVSNLNVAQAGFADTATVVDDTTTNTTFFPLFAAGTSGNQPLYGASTKYTFNPSTGAMNLVGAFTSTSLTPTTPLAAIYGGTGTTTGAAAPRVVTLTSSISFTPDADTTDIAVQANSEPIGTLTINAPTGTPVNGQRILFRIATTNAQTISYNAIYQASLDIALPTTLSASTTNYLGFFYNSTAAKWQLVAKVFGFA